MAGPLLTPTEDAAPGAVGLGERVGSLLIVNGDDLAEVRDWAATDPYNEAGLFESVTIAPLNSYGVDGELDSVY